MFTWYIKDVGARSEEFRTILQNTFDRCIDSDSINMIIYMALALLTDKDIERLQTKIYFVNGKDMDKATRRMVEH